MWNLRFKFCQYDRSWDWLHSFFLLRLKIVWDLQHKTYSINLCNIFPADVYESNICMNLESLACLAPQPDTAILCSPTLSQASSVIWTFFPRESSRVWEPWLILLTIPLSSIDLGVAWGAWFKWVCLCSRSM